jgi:hypothetical protein
MSDLLQDVAGTGWEGFANFKYNLGTTIMFSSVELIKHPAHQLPPALLLLTN